MKTKTAFTLVELLVVIAIIGILSGLIIVGMKNFSQSAVLAKAQVFSASLRDSLMMSLVSEWKLDQVASSTTLDSWGNNTCTLYGPTGTQILPQLQTSGCIYNKCLKFDGTDDYLDCGTGANMNVTGNISIAFWINPTNLSGSHGIISRGVYGTNNVPYAVDTNNASVRFTYLRTDATGASYSSTFSLEANKYAHIVITHTGVNNGKITFYKNGIAEASQNTTQQRTSQTASATLIGVFKRSTAQGGDTYFNGLIDNVRIYSNIVPTSQIREEYYAGLNRLLASGEIPTNDYNDFIESL